MNTNVNFDLISAEASARDFLAKLPDLCSNEGGFLTRRIIPDWAQRSLQKKTPDQATFEKIGSGSFVRRRPDNSAPYLNYIEQSYHAKKPLRFRLGCGPLKNIHVCGSQQLPDFAEFLMLAQLARFASAVAALYPFGLNIQIIPDDERACSANGCAREFTNSYISGLGELIKDVKLDGWITLEQGQRAICESYCVAAFKAQAEDKLEAQRGTPAFTQRWERAVRNASANVFPAPSLQEAEQAAWRYLVAHEAELLSGIWSVNEFFPLRYGRHEGFYQLYTMKENQTQLPWQLSLPWPPRARLGLSAA